jgi:hypothetical protein
MAHACEQALRLAALIDGDGIDAAIDAELMDFVPCPACDPAATSMVADAQRRLAFAWAARDRYRAREARLQRIATERAAHRAPPAQAAKPAALPSAAAAILERAKAKAAQRSQ